MKSKKSFFNKTIFKKNVTLYWPIWTVYTILLLCVQPGVLGVNYYYSGRHNNGVSFTYGSLLSNFISVLQLDFWVYITTFVSILVGMAMFHYLYNHKSASMIHAFPVDRTQLFVTNVISGLAFLAVPQTLSAVVTAMIALCNGISEVHYAGIWLLLMLGVDVVTFSVVTFCAMITGHIVALPVYAHKHIPIEFIYF